MKKLIFILLMLACIACGAQAPPKGTDAIVQPTSIDSMENEIRVVLDRVSPSLVKVVAENARKYVATGIALEDGMVITTALVTRHPFERIFVETIKGETIAARIAGQDDRSGLTLLRLDKKGLRPLPQAGQAGVGNWVALVGLFYDRFPSIFQGIVSSLSENELILNAPVAPGAAGGAVVNKKGELLGIILGSVGFSFTPDLTFKDHSAAIVVSGSKSASGGLCYAIPSAQVRHIAAKLKNGGKTDPRLAGRSLSTATPTWSRRPTRIAGGQGRDRRRRPYRGTRRQAGRRIPRYRRRTAIPLCGRKDQRQGQPLGQAGAWAWSWPSDTGRRCPGWNWPNAASAPSRRPRRRFPPACRLLRKRHAEPGRTSGRNAGNARAGIGPAQGAELCHRAFNGARQLGVDVMEITVDLAGKFGVAEGYGLLVSRVNEGSAADKAGLQAGDIIVRASAAPSAALPTCARRSIP